MYNGYYLYRLPVHLVTGYGDLQLQVWCNIILCIIDVYCFVLTVHLVPGYGDLQLQRL